MVRQLLYSFSKWLPKFPNVPSSSLTSTTVADDLKKLEDVVKTIQPVLQDAEDKENRESSVKLWLKELRDVAYDAEDVLLEFQYHILQAQVLEMRTVAAESEITRKKKRVDGGEEVNPFASGSNLAVGEVSIQHDMADRIKKINEEFASGSNFAVGEVSIPKKMVDSIKKMRERFEEIKRDKVFLELKPEDGERLLDSVSEYPRETTSMATDIYGREDDKNRLIDLLLSESKYEVIAVVGKEGLGKTTLAQLVYNDPRVSNYFPEMRIWIWVPDNCNLQRLKKLMIERITNTPCNLSDLSSLRESLQKSLQGKRLFLVLDDVWINEKEHLWEPLSNLLLQNAEMTKIIVTTRNAEIAETMKATVLYPLGYLPWQYCWQLFLSRAFGGRNPEDFPRLVEIGKEIVSKCDGLPLAVKSLGALLRQYETDDEWKDVLDSDLWELVEETNILPALRLSYSRMPNNLKPCFEICSMFPKYHFFDKNELVKLWAAHGYVQREAGKDVEEIGYKYFNELHRRSFFDEYEDEVDMDYDIYGGKVWVTRYSMHDNIRDLAHYVLNETDMKHKIRHLFVSDDEERICTVNDTGAPRTLIVVGDVSKRNDILLELPRLMHLRYLDIALAFKEEILLPEGIRNLICLRHLKIDVGTNRRAIESVCHLYNLVALEIRCNLDIDIYDEDYLFDTSEEEFLLPEDLGRLICLRHLKIDVGTNMRGLEYVGHLYNLVALEIRCEGLVEFPESLRNLVSLTSIYFRDFKNDQLPALGELPSLKSLILKGLFRVKSIGNEFCRGVNNRRDAVAFPSLISLVFEHMPVWEKWDGLRDGDIPQLQKLEINHCRELSSLPALPNLKTLKASHDKKLCLPSRFGELTKLEVLSGNFAMRNDEQFGFLKNLVNLKYLTLENVGEALITEACLRENQGIEKLILRWSSDDFDDDHPDTSEMLRWSSDDFDDDHPYPSEIEDDKKNFTLRLIVGGGDHGNSTSEHEFEPYHSESEDYVGDDNSTWEHKVEAYHSDSDSDSESKDYDGHDNSTSDDEKNASFCLLNNFQPHTSLLKLEIVDYNGDRWPSWIGDPSFNKLTHVMLDGCINVDKLPTLGQLPSLKKLSLSSIYRLKRIGDEFSRGTNGRHDVVAFPSLIELSFNFLSEWEEWHDCGGLVSDFPKLRELNISDCTKLSSLRILSNLSFLLKLSINNCPALQLSSERSFPPNLESFRYEGHGSRMCLSPGDDHLMQLKISGDFEVRKDELFDVWNKLNSTHLVIRGLGNFCKVFKVEDAPRPRISMLSLSWRPSPCINCDASSIALVIYPNNHSIANDEGRNEIEPSLLLEYLQPDSDLRNLNIEGYESPGYPNWIGHPSFNELTRVHLGNCKNAQLPSLGQLPALRSLSLHYISLLKRIGHEFCRSTMSSNHVCKVAFPSLERLNLICLNDLEEWNEVLDGDFPCLQEFIVCNCPKLSSLWAQRIIRLHLQIDRCPQLQLSS